MNNALKVLETAKNCTLLDNLKLESVNFCIKDLFFNAVLGRIEQNYTQKDVSNYLGISKRTVINLEKGEVDKITLIFKYINKYSIDFANSKKEIERQRFVNSL